MLRTVCVRPTLWEALLPPEALVMPAALEDVDAFAGHLVTGAHTFNAEQAAHGDPGVTTLGFLFRSEFWFQSLQNWQSEFLAVGSLVVLSVHLRQRGSPESKPVHASHHATGAD